MKPFKDSTRLYTLEKESYSKLIKDLEPLCKKANVLLEVIPSGVLKHMILTVPSQNLAQFNYDKDPTVIIKY